MSHFRYRGPNRGKKVSIKWSDLQVEPTVPERPPPEPVVRFNLPKYKNVVEDEPPAEQKEKFRDSSNQRQEREKEKARRKRQEDKAERTRKEVAGMPKLSSFFSSMPKAKTEPLDITDEPTELVFAPVVASTDEITEDGDDVEILSKKDASVPTEDKDEDLRVIASLDHVTPTLRASAMLLDDDAEFQISSMENLDWPEREMLHRLIKPFQVGCCCSGLCTNREHMHGDDDTPLGIVEREKHLGNEERSETYQCAMPSDPFDAETFPLFDFLPEAFIDSGKEAGSFPKKRNGFKMSANSAEFSYASMMMRLRVQYFRELANTRALFSTEIKDIDKRYETTLLVATLSEDAAYAEEIKQAREREREKARNVFHARIETLENSMQELIVRTLMQCSGHTQFRLPLRITTKACFDVIKLPGGAERADQYYFDLFVLVARGSLDELEREKRKVAPDARLSIDAYYQNFIQQSHPDGWEEQQQNSAPVADVPDADEMEEFKEDGDNANKKRKFGDADSDADEDDKPHDNTKIRTTFPCPSQYALTDAQMACTALAFLVSMRIVGAHLLPVCYELGISDTVFDQLDYDKIVKNGAFIWQTWRNKRREEAKILDMKLSLEQDVVKRVKMAENLKSLRSTCMLAKEVYDSSEYVRAQFEKQGLVSYEVSGFWNEVSKASDDMIKDSPPLETALLEASKKGVFGAVLTIGASSSSVVFTNDLWFIFDSHGHDRTGFSTLSQFPNLNLLMKLIHLTFRPANDLVDNEFVRLRLNTYSLFVMHYK